MSELARRPKITRNRLTHAVNRLAEAGLVDRREDPRTGAASSPSSPTRA
ncbi:MarR family transcriptional regulator [Streptomyces canus]